MTRQEIIANHIATMRNLASNSDATTARMVFPRAIYAAMATPGCEAQGVRLVDLPHLAERVAEMADAHERVVGERDAYHAFALDVARHLAAPDAADLADKLAPADLPTLLDCVRGEYDSGHAAGDRARFARCVTDLTRALGGDERRPETWEDSVASVRTVVQERDDARAEVAALRAQVAELTDGIDAVIDRKRIADDKPEILHTLQRHYEMVCETAGKANDTIEDIGKVLKIDALESDDIVADVRARVAELTRLGASIHKAADAARKAERADVVAELRRLYAAQRSEETPVAATLDILIGLFESGTHEGAATPK